MKKHTATNELAEPAQHLLEDAQELLTATAHVAEEKVVEARRRLSAAIEKGKEAWQSVQDTAVSGAKATDRAIREHPYHSIGIAFGVGMLLGFLVRRRE
jgi:ElaB/YqjD/DUF883 family membrane-anchored ribosome-binding protein